MNIFITFSLIFLSFGHGKDSGVIAATVQSNAQKTPTALTVTSVTANVSVNVTWTFSREISVTNVIMTVKNLQGAQWAAVGLGQQEEMGEAHVFMCKRLADNTIVINRYMNPQHHKDPEPAGSEQGGVFTPGQQQFLEGVVICQFTLSNFTQSAFEQVTDLRPLSQSGSYYPIFAVGLLDTDNSPMEHHKDSCTAQSKTIKLNRNEIVLYKLTDPDHEYSIKNHVLKRAKRLLIKRD